MYPLLYTGAASVGIHYSRMRTETIRYFKIPSKTSLSSHKLDKFDSVKTSRSRILYSSSGYTLGTSPSVVHSSGTAVRCSPQTCKIIGVCRHSTQYPLYCVHTPVVHAADLTIFVWIFCRIRMHPEPSIEGFEPCIDGGGFKMIRQAVGRDFTFQTAQ